MKQTADITFRKIPIKTIIEEENVNISFKIPEGSVEVIISLRENFIK